MIAEYKGNLQQSNVSNTVQDTNQVRPDFGEQIRTSYCSVIEKAQVHKLAVVI